LSSNLPSSSLKIDRMNLVLLRATSSVTCAFQLDSSQSMFRPVQKRHFPVPEDFSPTTVFLVLLSGLAVSKDLRGVSVFPFSQNLIENHKILCVVWVTKSLSWTNHPEWSKVVKDWMVKRRRWKGMNRWSKESKWSQSIQLEIGWRSVV
jgi:hypothetical protein